MKVIVYQNKRNDVKVYDASSPEAEGTAYLGILKDMRENDAFEGWDKDDPSMYEEAVRCLEENDWGSARIPVKYLFRYYASHVNLWYKLTDVIPGPKKKPVMRTRTSLIPNLNSLEGIDENS